MRKQEKAQQLLQDVSAGLTALATAVRHARAASLLHQDHDRLIVLDQHAHALQDQLHTLKQAWPLPVSDMVPFLEPIVHQEHGPSASEARAESPSPHVSVVTIEPPRRAEEPVPSDPPIVETETSENRPDDSPISTPVVEKPTVVEVFPVAEVPSVIDVPETTVSVEGLHETMAAPSLTDEPVQPVPSAEVTEMNADLAPSIEEVPAPTAPALTPLPLLIELPPLASLPPTVLDDDDDAAEEVVDNFQLDVLSLFFEESPELVDGIVQCFELIRDGRKTFMKESIETEVVRELHRLLHTLKGNSGMMGAYRLRNLIHIMESTMEDAEAGRLEILNVLTDLEERFDQVQLMINAIEQGDYNYRLPKKNELGQAAVSEADVDVPVPDEENIVAPPSTTSTTAQNTAQNKKLVRVNAELLDRLVNEANEARLTRSGLEGTVAMLQTHAHDLDENVQGLIKMLRELEIHAESQIQSRRTQIEETGEEFDPLEFDRFTRLQELARFLSERAHDMLDLQQGVSRATSEQETLLAYQERSINEIQESLTKTRLLPFGDTAGPLIKMTKLAAREMYKDVDLDIVGDRNELDRALIEKITQPLSHALRNAVAHGIEPLEERLARGKPPRGKITITVKQDAGRVFITIADDGGGIRVERVRQKAIERGIWAANMPMSDQEAADMVCMPSFSTSDKVSELAGRGVGMDVVRSDVLALGGRFDLRSIEGKGLTVALQLPTTLSTASTLVVEAAGERVAIPVECIEHVLLMKRDEVLQARERGWIEVTLQDEQKHRVDFRYLPSIMGLKVPMIDPNAYNQVVVVRESDTVVAVLVDRLLGTHEVPIRPIGRALSRLPGIVGTTVLSDGTAAFVIDPARTRAAFIKQNTTKVTSNGESDALLPIVEAQEMQELPTDADEDAAHRGMPLVMVVDDSLTVRKASARFLQREGYAHVLAKDGQEAVEMLTTVTPDLILLDVEMPRMDGFDFAKHVREHPRHHNVPIIMITSRIADKHRKRADAIGVNGYLGKPFIEEELLAMLHQYTGQTV